jgi:NADH dehydrogenase
VEYDTLIVATGSTHAYFGHDDWEEHAPGLKTVEDATDIRRRVLSAFEQAEREGTGDSSWLTFVVVGGGPTGVELAGAIAEVAHDTLRHDFRRIDPAQARIILVEGRERVLSTYPPDLSANAEKTLRRLGVELLLSSRVIGVEDGSVKVLSPDGSAQGIPARTVLWAAGVRGTHFGETVAQRTGVQRDSVGRLHVERDLSLPGQPNIFVIGDLANYSHQTGEPLPGVAQVAMQQGAYVSRLISARERGTSLPAFHYKDLGMMATIGRAAAVADLGRLHLSGWLGWASWLFIHLLYIVQFENKLLVLTQWAWSYITRNRSARLITGEDLVKPVNEA